jgi:hypothetical protein
MADSILKQCSVEEFRKMSLRGPKGRGNLLSDEPVKRLGAFEIASLAFAMTGSDLMFSAEQQEVNRP